MLYVVIISCFNLNIKVYGQGIEEDERMYWEGGIEPWWRGPHHHHHHHVSTYIIIFNLYTQQYYKSKCFAKIVHFLANLDEIWQKYSLLT